jgi:hypothetical protein
MQNDRMNQDLDHLKLLATFHRVVAILIALFGCFPLIHLTIGVALLAGGLPSNRRDLVPAAVVGGLFVGIAVFIMVLLWTFSVLVFRAARKLESRRGYTYCLVIAGLLCMFMPFGTALGVFTLVVLVRPSVKEMFAAQDEPRLST